MRQQKIPSSSETSEMMPRTIEVVAPLWSSEPGIGGPYAGAHAACHGSCGFGYAG